MPPPLHAVAAGAAVEQVVPTWPARAGWSLPLSKPSKTLSRYRCSTPPPHADGGPALPPPSPPLPTDPSSSPSLRDVQRSSLDRVGQNRGSRLVTTRSVPPELASTTTSSASSTRYPSSPVPPFITSAPTPPRIEIVPGVATEPVIACAAEQNVVAAKTGETVAPIVADNLVCAGVADPVDVGRAEQRQVPLQRRKAHRGLALDIGRVDQGIADTVLRPPPVAAAGDLDRAIIGNVYRAGELDAPFLCQFNLCASACVQPIGDPDLRATREPSRGGGSIPGPGPPLNWRARPGGG